MKNAFVARAEAFLEEFPFLNRYAKVEELSSQPKVERVDLNLLDKIGHQYVDIEDDGVRFVLIGADGEELKTLRQTKAVLGVSLINLIVLLIAPLFGRLDQGETVYEGIKQLNDANRVRFVLKIQNNRTEITLYKVPSGVSFSDWLSHIKETATDELKKNLAGIDNI